MACLPRLSLFSFLGLSWGFAKKRKSYQAFVLVAVFSRIVGIATRWILK